MKEKAIEERLRFYTEMVKVLIFLIVTVGGGIISLLYRLDDVISKTLFVVGLMLEIGFGFVLINLLIAVRNLLRRMENDAG